MKSVNAKFSPNLRLDLQVVKPIRRCPYATRLADVEKRVRDASAGNAVARVTHIRASLPRQPACWKHRARRTGHQQACSLIVLGIPDFSFHWRGILPASSPHRGPHARTTAIAGTGHVSPKAPPTGVAF